MKQHTWVLLGAIGLMAGCANDPAKEQAANKPPPEGNLCRTTIMPVTPKKEDKNACLLESRQSLAKCSGRCTCHAWPCCHPGDARDGRPHELRVRGTDENLPGKEGLHVSEISPASLTMCGRYVRTTPIDQFADLFHAQGHPDCWASYNIAPSTQVLVARNAVQGGRELVTMKWGMVPAWSAEPKTAYSTINARAETVAQKPTFDSGVPPS